jgi:hypothetical protein
MEKDWQLIHTTDKAESAEYISKVLEKEGLHVVSINKKDSSYQIGEIELYVLKFEAEKASEILNAIKQ